MLRQALTPGELYLGYIYECCHGNGTIVMAMGIQYGGRRARGADQRAERMHCASLISLQVATCVLVRIHVQLEGELSGNELEEEGEEGEGSLSCGSGPDSELATGTSAGRDGGEHLMDNLSETSDGAWDTDLDTDGQHHTCSPAHIIYLCEFRRCVYVSEEKEAYDATGGAAYRKCCDMLGIVPVSHFLHNLQAKDTTICLRHHGLGPKGAKAIAVALTVSPELVAMKHKYHLIGLLLDAVQYKADHY